MCFPGVCVSPENGRVPRRSAAKCSVCVDVWKVTGINLTQRFLSRCGVAFHPRTLTQRKKPVSVQASSTVKVCNVSWISVC